MAKKKEFQKLILLSARTFDLKRLVSAILKEPFRKIQLFSGPYDIDDHIYMAALSLTEQSVVRSNVLQEGIVQLYFIDLQSQHQELSFPSGEFTLGRLAAHLEKDNLIEIGFVWEGSMLPRYTRIHKIVCDSLVPIYCFPRSLILNLMFEKHPEWDKGLWWLIRLSPTC
jgi:hypothetical protein